MSFYVFEPTVEVREISFRFAVPLKAFGRVFANVGFVPFVYREEGFSFPVQNSGSGGKDDFGHFLVVVNDVQDV